MKNRVITGMIVLFSLLLAACSPSKSNENTDGKIQAIATFYPMYEFAKAVIGEEGEVELLIPAGTEAHDYEPSAKSVAQMSDADAIIYNSHAFETWMENILLNLDSDKTVMIEASRNIPLLSFESEHEEEHEADHEEAGHSHSHDEDPHVWLDPVLAMEQVAQIRDDLSQKYPEKQEIFTENAANYLTELSRLDQEYQKAFKDATQRTFVTQHLAFSYLAKQYGLTQESMAGLSSEEEPTPKRLAELKNFIIDHEIEYLYFEDNTAGKMAMTLAEETGVELAVLSTIESVSNDQQAAGKTYLSLMEDNLKALQLSLR